MRQSADYTTLAHLKKSYPKFTVWKILTLPEQQELIDEDFAVIHYANVLVARHFAIEPRTLKYDRSKIRASKSAD
jgi:hypothetical protein